MKNRGKLLSPCMYPIEYRWISEAIPVMNRIIAIDSGSSRKPDVDRKSPAGIQVKSRSS